MVRIPLTSVADSPLCEIKKKKKKKKGTKNAFPFKGRSAAHVAYYVT